MSVWLDLIGSFIFGTLLALNVMQMNTAITEQSYKSAMVYVAQDNAVILADIVEDDLRKMGYAVADTAITLADSVQIRFLADLGADGSVDTLFYYLGSPSLESHTTNPKDRPLYRKLNGETAVEYPLGITTFAFSYFNANGDSLSLPVTPGDIREIRVDIITESDDPYATTTHDTTYAQAFMQLRIRPKNL